MLLYSTSKETEIYYTECVRLIVGLLTRWTCNILKRKQYVKKIVFHFTLLKKGKIKKLKH